MTPNDAHLNRLEQELNVHLPRSYRAFVQVFGPGILMGSHTILAPGYRGATVIDFLANNKWQAQESARRAEPERVGRLIAFADFLCQYLAWDPHEIVLPEEHEYRIYLVPKQLDQPLLPIADTFPQFIEKSCIEGKFWSRIGAKCDFSWEDEKGEIRTEPVFEPIGLGPTSSV
ncbi:SMI1/KNR4 family protein [Blastopirellula marina]|uniref:SMI1/KNR4 family protein n=1 Tax=Blastopirellula marina TaxID=124 RepID=UPI001304A4E2|nr:SMI1/KNR4 family protein [Blastopirellula marina]